MVLLTVDKDFANVLRYPPSAHRGIVVLRIDADNEARVHGVLLRLLADHPPATLDGVLAVVTEHKYRLRQA
jgi:hypothetical protein